MLLAIFCLSFTAFAASASYSIMLPGVIGHKTVCTSYKTSSAWSTFSAQTDSYCQATQWIGWIDGEINGSYDVVASDFTAVQGQTITRSYDKFTPSVGVDVRARCKGNGYAGQAIHGSIDFR